METCECGDVGGGGTGGGGVDPSPTPTADNTPVITGIDPSDWTAGKSQSVTFTGEYFGTNAPTLGFSPGTGISYALSTYSDTQIVASVNVAAGTPNEDVNVSVTSNGYGGAGFTSGGTGASPTSSPVYADVNSPMNTPEVTVIAWIDGTQISLPSGESNALYLALNSGSTICAAEEGLWAAGSLGAVSGPNDVAYANAWLLKAGANTPPPSSIVPSIQSLQVGSFRLFNDFGNSTGSVQVGWTPDPCGLIPSPVPGQSSPYNGSTGVVASSKNSYQLAEGRVGTVGQTIYATLNNKQSVPWIWSVVEFDASGTSVNITSPANYQIFPTYYVYVNGELESAYTRVQTSVSTIVEPIYQNSQLLPSQIK
jgi:hypothetical protein